LIRAAIENLQTAQDRLRTEPPAAETPRQAAFFPVDRKRSTESRSLPNS
jgi:hypothetical protein